MRTKTRPAEEKARAAFDLIVGIERLSNAEVARRAEMSTTTVRDLRTGETLIRYGTAEKLAAALDLPVALFQMTEPEIHRWYADHKAGGEAQVVTYHDFVDNFGRYGDNRPKHHREVGAVAA